MPHACILAYLLLARDALNSAKPAGLACSRAADLSDEWMDVDDKGIPVAVNSFKYKLTAHKADKKKK